MAVEDYIPLLDKLALIKALDVVFTPDADAGLDARLTVTTATGQHTFAVAELRGHLSLRSVDRVAARRRAAATQGEALLILAPHVGPRVGNALVSEAHTCYLDLSGNCHLETDSLLIHIEGRSPQRARVQDKGLRAAAYQVLFAYLAEPDLLARPLRAVAASSDVSRQAVDDMRRRLVEDAHVVKVDGRWRWVPQRRLDDLARWAEGYRSSVRPRILVGTFRTPDKYPADLEQRIVDTLGEDPTRWRWGGSAAGFRMTGHFRGRRTVLHLRGEHASLSRELRAAADPSGPLTILRDLGDLSWPRQRDIIHPLIAYAEMLAEDTERAKEGAQELFREEIEPQWETTSS